MTKYKISDKVKIRSDLIVDEEYGSMNFIEDMDCFSGKVLTIGSMYENYYEMIEDNGSFGWSDEMIECKVKDDIDEYYNKDILNFWINHGTIVNKKERNIKGAIVEGGDIVYGHRKFNYILVNNECIHFKEVNEDENWF